jgi:hypothetical protein
MKTGQHVYNYSHKHGTTSTINCYGNSCSRKLHRYRNNIVASHQDANNDLNWAKTQN